MPAIISPRYQTVESWEAQYGEAYRAWSESGWSSSPDATRRFLNALLKVDLSTSRALTPLPHQAEALQRIVFTLENTPLRGQPLLETLATGTGKTVVFACFMAYLCLSGAPVDIFLLLCPNTIVRERLRRDFEGGAIFERLGLLNHAVTQDLKNCSIIDGYRELSNLRGFKVLVANRHQFQQGYAGGNDHLAYLLNNKAQLTIMNDEAHNTRGSEYTRTLRMLSETTVARLDLTATPDRADNLRPQSHEIYSLNVLEAITGNYKKSKFFSFRDRPCPKLVKRVIVYRPSIKSMGAVNSRDLTFVSGDKGKPLRVNEID